MDLRDFDLRMLFIIETQSISDTESSLKYGKQLYTNISYVLLSRIWKLFLGLLFFEKLNFSHKLYFTATSSMYSLTCCMV